jgi:Domain of unknown function (DUF4136)
MKSVFTIFAMIVLTSALLCTEAHAQKTSANYDKNATFSNYKTFAFDKGNARNPLVNAMIVAAVERELTSRGLTKVGSDADLLVVYVAASGPNLQVANVPFYTVVNPAYSGMVGGASMAMWDVTTGTLVIDLYDQKANRTVFRGTATQVLERAASANPAADAKLVSKPINNGIAKIFKKYPVKNK